MARKVKPIKSIKAWALVDPVDRRLAPHRLYDRAFNGGPGSVTEGWKRIRVEIRPIKPKKRQGR